jgi:hypothetical protein
LPFARRVAVWASRVVVIEPVKEKPWVVRVAALLVTIPPKSSMTTTR